MKKILLASTALVLSAGIANAQAVTINGYARMGVVSSRTAAGVTTTSIENRYRLQFNAATEADHGLSFGAFARVQSGTSATTAAAGYAGTLAQSRVWVEANGLRLTFGNQDGAIQSRLVGAQTVGYTGGTFAGSSAGMYIIPLGQSSNASGPTSAAGVTPGNANRTVALSYDTAGYFVHISHDMMPAPGNSATEIAVGGTFGAVSVMAGYANRSGATYGVSTDITTVGAAYDGGSWGASAVVARVNAPAGAVTNWLIGGNVELGGGNLNGYVGRYVDGVVATSDTTWGLGYAYGLGGGARLAAGIERTNDATRAEVGVRFTF